MTTIKTFGPVDERSLKQLERCMEAGDAEYGVLCADHHPGYSQPIGGAIAYEGYVSPSGVGYDIGCGNKAARTELTRADLDELGGVEKIMREITRRVSFGMGVAAQERVDHPVLEKIRAADFGPQRALAAPRGVAARHRRLGQPLRQPDGGRGREGVGRRPLRLARLRPQDRLGLPRARRGQARSGSGRSRARWTRRRCCSRSTPSSARPYMAAMELAGDYAYAGRDVVVAKVLEILGAEAVKEVHNHHNFAWREEHFGRQYWVVRKGCTPARPGQEGFVGGSMGDESVILEGVESAGNEQALYSTVHGAGRVMSRSQAAGRVRRRKRWGCGHRDCPYVAEEPGTCPEHGSKLRKVWVEEQVKPGLVDWPAVQARLREQGIVLLGGGADEAPEVYKRLPEVLAAHGDTIRVKHTLRPLGVAMAGRDVYDPYKD